MNKLMIPMLIAFTVTFGFHVFGASKENNKYVQPSSTESSSGDDSNNLDTTIPNGVIFSEILKQLGAERLDPNLQKNYRDLLKPYLKGKKKLLSSELGALTNRSVAVLVQVLPVNLEFLGLDCKNLDNKSLEAILTRC